MCVVCACVWLWWVCVCVCLRCVCVCVYGVYVCMFTMCMCVFTLYVCVFSIVTRSSACNKILNLKLQCCIHKWFKSTIKVASGDRLRELSVRRKLVGTWRARSRQLWSNYNKWSCEEALYDSLYTILESTWRNLCYYIDIMFGNFCYGTALGITCSTVLGSDTVDFSHYNTSLLMYDIACRVIGLVLMYIIACRTIGLILIGSLT